ncbi:M56 family metallopeptidase [Brevibacillus borstelensis]|uniref:M56 family metallopeptidase n=1 Tax=Brevibacillus borstelensis TaxID=45462 RepID=UPI0030BBE653
MDILIRAFLWFVDATVAASVVLLLVMAVQRLLRRHLSLRLAHALWLLVLLRLLVPVFPESPVSVFHLFPMATQSKQASLFDPLAENRSRPEVSGDHRDAPIPEAQTNPPLMEVPPPPADVPARQADEAPEQASSAYPLGLQVAAVVWLAGALALMLYVAAFSVRMSRQRRQMEPLTDPEILSIAEACRVRLEIGKPLHVYTGQHANSPYLSGFFRPWIYLPEAMARELSPSQLTHILLHELAHHKRKDIMWNAIGSLALAVHWMNPLVWIGMRRMKADRELACDACVLEALGEAEAVPYGMTIIECLKRFSPAGRQSELLYFFGPNYQMEMKRRIHMIKSFKKGSYKLSVAAVLCVGVLGAATLTNASSPVPASAPQAPGSQSASAEAAGKARILFDYELMRPYKSLEKVVQVSDFKFKVPAALPEGYRFTDIYFAPKEKAGTSFARLDFIKVVEGIGDGRFRLTARPAEADLEAVTNDFYHSDFKLTVVDGDVEKKEILAKKKETLSVQGQKVVKITIEHETNKEWQRRYFWQDQGVQYEIETSSSSLKVKDEEIGNIIPSMKDPDQELYKRFISEERFSEDIYDTDDLKQVPEAIGFAPKLPLQLPGAIPAEHARVGPKLDFSFPENETDKKNKTFDIFYYEPKPKDERREGIKRVKLQQIKNNNMYETFKKNGNVAFSRINGEKYAVKAEVIKIAGKELLKTAPYKDDESNHPSNVGMVSYFWKENDVCFQVTFWNDGPGDDGPERNKILQFLMNEKPIDLANFMK